MAAVIAVRVIENNQALGRYQLFEQGDLAGFVQYSMHGEEMWLRYTQLKRRYRSEEIVDDLLMHVLEDLLRRRLSLLPFCPAMRAFMVEWPEYARLVPVLWQQRFMAPSPVPRRPMDKVRYTGSPRRNAAAADEPVVKQLPVWSSPVGHGRRGGASGYSNGAPLLGT